MAERKLAVTIVGDSRSLERAFTRSSKSAKGFERDIEGVSRGISNFTKGAALGGLAAALGAVGLAARLGFKELQESRKVTAQTGAVLRSTGQIAGVTAEHVDELSQALLRKTGIDDEQIKSAQNMLLTFTNVRNVAGAGNDIFDQATKSVLDMSVALGIDATQASVQLGKALQDPILGITALRRRGVSFTEAQKAQIRTLVESGRVMQAQKLILAELNTEFGGSAEAAGRADGGIAILQQTFANFTAELVEKFMPAIEDAVERLQTWLDDPANTDRVVKEVEETAGAFAGLVGSLRDANNKGNKAMDGLRQGMAVGAAETRAAILRPLSGLPTPLSDYFGREREKTEIHLRQLRGEVAAGGTAIVGEWQDSLDQLASMSLSAALSEGARNAPDNRGARPRVAGGADAPGALDAIKRAAGGITAAQRNRWFDQMIGRRESRVQDIRALEGQVAALERIAVLIRARLAITKDVTRRLKLEDDLLDVARQQRALREEIAANQIAAKQLAADKQRERIERERERAAKALETIKQRQFRALGLAKDGSDIVPGVANLQKQRASILKSIQGTFLNNDKTKSMMERIKKVLSGGFGDVSRDVRSKVADMLDDIRQQLKNFDGYKRTIARQAFDPNKLLAGLGLSPAELKAVRGRISRVGPGGRVAGRGVGAFGMVAPVGGGKFQADFNLYIDGQQVEATVTRRNNARKRRNPPQKRGPTVAY